MQQLDESEITISGNVKIDPSVAIAPGVILQAAPNYHIFIGTGVSIGRGVILTAVNGSIEIEAGAILGSEVLIVGESRIGLHACVGSATTIYNASVEAKSVIAANSLLGDTTRQVSLEEENQRSKAKTLEDDLSFPDLPDLWDEEPQPSTPLKSEPPKSDIKPTPENQAESKIPEIKVEIKQPDIESESISTQKAPVVGQIYINQLLMTLFPHKKASNSID